MQQVLESAASVGAAVRYVQHGKLQGYAPRIRLGGDPWPDVLISDLISARLQASALTGLP